MKSYEHIKKLSKKKEFRDKSLCKYLIAEERIEIEILVYEYTTNV